MSTSASEFATRVATLKDIGRKMQALLRRRPLRSAKAPAIYMPGPSPFASETPEERRARHLRRWRQVQAGNVEAPPEIPGSPVDVAGLGAAVPPLGAGQ